MWWSLWWLWKVIWKTSSALCLSVILLWSGLPLHYLFFGLLWCCWRILTTNGGIDLKLHSWCLAGWNSKVRTAPRLRRRIRLRQASHFCPTKRMRRKGVFLNNPSITGGFLVFWTFLYQLFVWWLLANNHFACFWPWQLSSGYIPTSAHLCTVVNLATWTILSLTTSVAQWRSSATAAVCAGEEEDEGEGAEAMAEEKAAGRKEARLALFVRKAEGVLGRLGLAVEEAETSFAEATERGVLLSVDEVKAWSAEGQRVEERLKDSLAALARQPSHTQISQEFQQCLYELAFRRKQLELEVAFARLSAPKTPRLTSRANNELDQIVECDSETPEKSKETDIAGRGCSVHLRVVGGTSKRRQIRKIDRVQCNSLNSLTVISQQSELSHETALKGLTSGSSRARKRQATAASHARKKSRSATAPSKNGLDIVRQTTTDYEMKRKQQLENFRIAEKQIEERHRTARLCAKLSWYKVNKEAVRASRKQRRFLEKEWRSRRSKHLENLRRCKNAERQTRKRESVRQILAEQRMAEIYHRVHSVKVDESSMGRFHNVLTKRKLDGERAHHRWLRLKTAQLREFAALKKRMEAAMEADGDVLDQGSSSKEGLRAPLRGRASKEERARIDASEASDRALSLMIFKRFGKKGLKNRSSHSVLSLLRIVKIMEAAVESQRKQVFHLFKEIRAFYLGSKETKDLATYINGADEKRYHTKSSELGDSIRDEKNYKQFGDLFPHLFPDLQTTGIPQSKAGKVDKHVLSRLCDDRCKELLPAGWTLRIQKLFGDIADAGLGTWLKLDHIMNTFAKLESCSKCNDADGSGCHPVTECGDLLRFLRFCVAPHTARQRTRLRQLYRLREKVAWVAEAEDAMAKGAVERLLRLYEKMGSPGEGADDAGTDSIVDADVGNVPEAELLSLLRPLWDAFQEDSNDLPIHCCAVCEERKRLVELKGSVGRGRKRLTFGKNGQGAPFFAPRSDPSLARFHELFALFKTKRILMCKKCWGKMSGPVSASKGKLRTAAAGLLKRLSCVSPVSPKERKTTAGALERITKGDLDSIPRLSIFNACVLDPVPRQIRALEQLSPFHVNLVRLFKTFMSISLLTPVSGRRTANPRPALKGHSIVFPIGVSENLDLVAAVHAKKKIQLPRVGFQAIVLDRVSRNSDVAKSYLVQRKPVSDAIDELKRINPNYASVENTWAKPPPQSPSHQMSTRKAVLPPAPSAPAAIDSQPVSEEVREGPSGPAEVEEVLEVLQLGAQVNQELKANLEHRGSTRDVIYSANTVVANAVEKSLTDLEIFRDGKVHAVPQSSFDPSMESLPFPEAYPSGRFGLSYPRPIRVTEFEFVRHQLKRHDTRFAENTEYILAMLSRKVQRQISGGAYAATKISSWGTGGKDLSAATALKDLAVGKSSELNMRVDIVFRQVTGSPSFWRMQQNRLEALAMAFGPASLFVTVSNADYDSPELRAYLCALPSRLRDLTELSLDFLISNNAVGVAEFYKIRTDAILSVLLWNKCKTRTTRRAVVEYLAKVSGEAAEGIEKAWRSAEAVVLDEEDGGRDEGAEVDPEEALSDLANATTHLKGAGIFGLVSNYFIRLEYQNRGASHLHMLLWIIGAPELGTSPEPEIISWVRARMTARLPDAHVSPGLHALVQKHQTHECRPSCRTRKVLPHVTYHKGKRVKRRRIVTLKCKSGYPKIVSPMHRVNKSKNIIKKMMKYGMRADMVELPRTERELMINAYNPVLLLAARCNVDVKPVFDPGAMFYVCKYATKEEKKDAGENVYEAMNQAAPGKSLQSKLMSAGMSLFRGRTVGKEQAAAELLGFSHARLSATVKYEPIGARVGRTRVLRTKAALQKAVEQGAGQRPAYYDSNLDDYYPNRGEALEDLCFYSVAANYDRKTAAQFEAASPANRDQWVKGRSRASSGFVFYHNQRRRPKVLQFRKLMFKTQKQKEASLFSLLQLFVPWRHEGDLTEGFADVAEAYEAHKDTMKKNGLERFLKTKMSLDKVEEMLQEYREEAERELEEGDVDAFDFDPTAEGPEDFALADAGARNVLDSDELSELRRKLNPGQRAIFADVVNGLRHLAVHKGPTCPWPLCHHKAPPPVRQIVQGGAGTGKSTLIAAITAQVNEDALLPDHLKSSPVGSAHDAAIRAAHKDEIDAALQRTQEDTVCIVAPTGVASFLVGGTTIHRRLKVPVVMGAGGKAGNVALTGRRLKETKQEWEGKVLLVTDEISMVSAQLLNFMSFRMSEILGRDEAFGGMSVLLLGDIFQLQPVGAQALQPWKALSGSVFGKRVPFKTNLWRLFSVAQLTQSMRAIADPAFWDLLEKVAVGNADDQVIATLDSRRIFKDQDYDFADEADLKKHQSSGNFKAQRLPVSMRKWRLEDSLRESELVARAAEWVFQWERRAENAAKGSQMVTLFPRTRQCEVFGLRMMKLEGLSTTRIRAVDSASSSIPGYRFSKGETEKLERLSDMQGLEAELEIAVGARVMIRKNIDDVKGLINGARGVVRDIVYNARGNEVDHLVVELNERPDKPVKVERVRAVFKLHEEAALSVTRSQFPVITSYAITAHKAQGLTLENVLVDMGHLAGDADALVYVAISRVSFLQRLFILRLHPGVIRAHPHAVEEINRIRGLQGLPLVAVSNSLPSAHLDARQAFSGNRIISTDALGLYFNGPPAPAFKVPTPGRPAPKAKAKTPRKPRKTAKAPKPGRPGKAAKARAATVSSGTEEESGSEVGTAEGARESRARRKLLSSSSSNSHSPSPALLTSDRLRDAAKPRPTPKTRRLTQSPSDHSPSDIHQLSVPKPARGNTYLPLSWANNSCFLNSALQVLFAIPGFVDCLTLSVDENAVIDELLNLWHRRTKGQKLTSDALRAAILSIPGMAADFGGMGAGMFESPILFLSNILREEEGVRVLPRSVTGKFRRVVIETEAQCVSCGGDWRPLGTPVTTVAVAPAVKRRSNWPLMMHRFEGGWEEAGEIETRCSAGCFASRCHPEGYSDHRQRVRHRLQPATHDRSLVLVELNLLAENPDGGPAINLAGRRTVSLHDGFPIGDQRHVALAGTQNLPPAHFAAWSARYHQDGQRSSDFLCIDDIKEMEGVLPSVHSSLPRSLKDMTTLLLALHTHQPLVIPDLDRHPSDHQPIPPILPQDLTMKPHLIHNTIRLYKARSSASREQDFESFCVHPITPNYLTCAADFADVPDAKGLLDQWDKVKIHLGGICELEVDAIVNAANSRGLGGGGVDGAIHRAAGPDLLAECRTFGGIPVGTAKLSYGYRLPSPRICHAVGPDVRTMRPGEAGEEAWREAAPLLRAAYVSALGLAVGDGARSIAFPCISTGVFGFPHQPAARIALNAIIDFIVSTHGREIDSVVLCLVDKENTQAYYESIRKDLLGMMKEIHDIIRGTF